MVTKKELRIEAILTRNSLDIKNISEHIVDNILALEIYQKAKNVMVFYPLEYEVDLTGLFNDETKKFYLPKMDGEHLLVCPYKVGETLTESRFKTKEPITDHIENTTILDIIFVPALMADKKFNRLGYGGGFYDRFLAKVSKKTTKISVIPNELFVEEIPADDFDQRLDITVSEKLILCFSRHCEAGECG